MDWVAKLVAQSGERQPFSWRVFVTLLAVLVISAATFAALVRRWTTQRHRALLSDWAKGKGFRRISPERAPGPLAELKTLLSVREALADDATVLAALREADEITNRWHVLVRKLDGQWAPTGLRPTRASASLLDLFSLSSYPSLGNVERFVVYGSDSRMAAVISKSQFRGLLPPDIGLLLHGPWLILDFSTRPFDPIEFDRIIALAEQLVAHLPM